MDIHRYNKRTGFIDKTVNVTAENAKDEFDFWTAAIEDDPFCMYSRVKIVDTEYGRDIKDSYIKVTYPKVGTLVKRSKPIWTT